MAGRRGRYFSLIRFFFGAREASESRVGPLPDIDSILAPLRDALAFLEPIPESGSRVTMMADANPTAGFRSSISAEKPDRKGDAHPDWSDERQAVLPLVEAARRGDKDAFGQLYRRYHTRVFGLARFYLGDGAEDAVADTFMRAWSALPRYRVTAAPFVAWLYGIARHVVADELKRRRRIEARDHLPEEVVDPQHEERLALAAAIGKLPKQQRQIVEMKYLLGMKNAEVARAMKKTIGAVNAQQWRALQTLKNTLEQE
jgi:RNA polymerase sigma-70 factor (ECF subfamily)